MPSLTEKSCWPERDPELRKLWFDGLSDLEIGAKMGLSKGAIVGRRRRLGIAERGEFAPVRGNPVAVMDKAGPWPARDDELRAHWAGTLSTVEIGRAMKLSKNAVVNRAHRIGLPARPSPIVRDGVSGPKPVKCAARNEVLGTIVPEARKAAVPAPVVAKHLKSEPCCWPEGEPGTKTFRFCDAPSVPGKAYCPGHCEVAFAGRQMPQKLAEKIHAAYG